jgi:hypothetical protein
MGSAKFVKGKDLEMRWGRAWEELKVEGRMSKEEIEPAGRSGDRRSQGYATPGVLPKEFGFA